MGVHYPGRTLALLTYLASLPLVEKELRGWKHSLDRCPDPVLREQALASLALKKFHCQGGNVYSAFVKPSCIPGLTRAIVSLQTISDYLDNLCDRAGVIDARAFRHLHQAFTDALDPKSPPHDYYCHYPCRDDGGYLSSLVGTCRATLAGFPSYPAVQPEIAKLAALYTDLQVYKHLNPDDRQPLVMRWLEPYRESHPGLYWWELAAATGSTLGIFSLMAMATRTQTSPDEVEAVFGAYFPWIASLHILLDYFIDREEDRLGGDMNFTMYYPDLECCRDRLKLIAAKSFQLAQALPFPSFHHLVVEGLLAMYFSDPKMQKQGFVPLSDAILRDGGGGARRLYRICRLLRRAKIL
jgi:tetraprenyl-beta-curcumene synthase